MKVDRRTVLKLPILGAAVPAVIERGVAASVTQPSKLPGALHFGVMGDSGSGTSDQMAVADRIHARQRGEDPWSFLVALGDNVYENGEPEYFDSKFVEVYRELLEANIPVRSTLGNHDVRWRDGRDQLQEEAFGYIDGKDQYEFAAGPTTSEGKQLARFICLNSNRWLDAVDSGRAATERLQDELKEQLRDSDRYHWNIVYQHHPIYAHVKKTFGIKRGHGSSDELQFGLEPLLKDHGVDLVMAGHDHFYQKIRPVDGIHHLVSGGAGKLRGGIKNSKEVEHSALEYHFMDMGLDEDALHYQAIGADGLLIHSGRIDKRGSRKNAQAA